MKKSNDPVIMATSGLTKSGQPMTRTSVFNAVRAAAGPDYNTTIPMVDATSVNHYSRVIAANTELLDEFTRVLITKVVALYVQSAESWDSTLRQFHAGPAPRGIGVEVMARNLIPVKNWRDAKDGDHVGELFKDHGDDLIAQVQTIDELKYFAITVWGEELLYNAITTDNGLNAFIEDIFSQLRNSKEVYLYERILKTIWDYVENPEAEKLVSYTNKITDEASAKEFLVEAQATLGEFQFFSKDNNLQGVDMHSKGKTPVLITTPKVKAHIDINALAAMFNLEKENVSKYILLVDSLPEDVQAILTTDKFIQLYDRIDAITEMYHPIMRRTNYFNLLQVLVVNNQFENTRIFKSEDSSSSGEPGEPGEPDEPGEPRREDLDYFRVFSEIDSNKELDDKSKYTSLSLNEYMDEFLYVRRFIDGSDPIHESLTQTSIDYSTEKVQNRRENLRLKSEYTTVSVSMISKHGEVLAIAKEDLPVGIEADISNVFAGFLTDFDLVREDYDGQYSDLIFTPKPNTQEEIEFHFSKNRENPLYPSIDYTIIGRAVSRGRAQAAKLTTDKYTPLSIQRFSQILFETIQMKDAGAGISLKTQEDHDNQGLRLEDALENELNLQTDYTSVAVSVFNNNNELIREDKMDLLVDIEADIMVSFESMLTDLGVSIDNYNGQASELVFTPRVDQLKEIAFSFTIDEENIPVEEEIDYTALNQKIAEAEAIDLTTGEYTPYSVSNFERTLSDSQSMADPVDGGFEGLTQVDIDMQADLLGQEIEYGLNLQTEFTTVAVIVSEGAGLMIGENRHDVPVDVELDVMAFFEPMFTDMGVTVDDYDGEASELVFTPTAEQVEEVLFSFTITV